MKKADLTISFDEDKLEALEFVLRKDHSSVRRRMDEALRQLYEQSVPEAVREYLDHKAGPARPRPSRAKSAQAGTPDREGGE